MNDSHSAVVIVVPLGLFGLHTKMRRVASVIASAIAARSTRCCASSGIGRGVAPATCAKMG